MNETQAAALAQELSQLTTSQQAWVASVVAQFKLPHEFTVVNSDLITPTVLDALGDTLRIHHAFSRQALTKDRFEFAFERAVKNGGHCAALVNSRTNRGHDMTVNEYKVSLKTEAASNIKPNSLHISKFMELGKGAWELPLLRDAFLEHMTAYDRIFSFRCLLQGPATYFYELVEIPKALFLEGVNAELVVQSDSRQNPKPGYGYVKDTRTGEVKFALYFDGGTERKLQIKAILKKYCQVHATWHFESAPLE